MKNKIFYVSLLWLFCITNIEADANYQDVSGNQSNIINNNSKEITIQYGEKNKNVNKGVLSVISNNPAHKEHKIIFFYPKEFGECFKIPGYSSPKYSILFDMGSEEIGCSFSDDPYKFSNSVIDANLLKAEVFIEKFPKEFSSDTDSGGVFYPEELYSFTKEQKEIQFKPLKDIYKDKKISAETKYLLEGNEPTGDDYRDVPKELILWNNVDGYSDIFETSYISSKDNFLRGACYFFLSGLDFNFNLNYRCLMFNPDDNVVFGVSLPLHNVVPKKLQNSEVFKGISSSREVISRIKNAKIEIINGNFPKAVKNAISQVRAIAASSTLY